MSDPAELLEKTRQAVRRRDPLFLAGVRWLMVRGSMSSDAASVLLAWSIERTTRGAMRV